MDRLRNRHLFLTDLLLLGMAVYLSYVLRLEDFEFVRHWPGMLLFAASVLTVTPLLFRRAGIYARFWRYASIDELILLSGAVTVAVMLATLVSFFLALLVQLDPYIPRSIPFIFLMLALVATAGPRMCVRILDRRRGRTRRTGSSTAIPVVIMGAGDAGAMMAKELQHNPQLGMEVVGFLDDDSHKHRMVIHGVPVLGDRQHIAVLAKQGEVRQVIIAMPTAPGKEIRAVVDTCERAGIKTKIVPGLYELLDGTATINQLRDVQIEDLLRREQVHTEFTTVKSLLQGKRVLVTGAGGSIGSELCRQIVRCDPQMLVLLGHGENSIFAIRNELENRLKSGKVNCQIVAVVADIRSADRLRAVFSAYLPQVVFHAAAHKHVPLMELNPIEAIDNNVLGTANLLRSAMAFQTERFIMISTDKAVNPTNIMGASKRAAELLVHQAAKVSGKPYAAVRFGNVLGSRGSVVLTFKDQIAAGGPVTVTHPDMCRYFMTIPEAVQLVLQAAVLEQGGEVFVLDMGEPVKIVDLARDMIELSGLEVDKDISIVFSGIRPGEKLFEELFVTGEEYVRTPNPKIFTAANASQFVPDRLDEMVDALAVAVRQDDTLALLRSLHRMLPEYRPSLLTEADTNGTRDPARFQPVESTQSPRPAYLG